MSEPQTIRQYLAALNASLEVGLRSRRRILAEVQDHLCQATDEQRQRGISPGEAQRRAVVAFGPAEQVAARFDAGLIGALDRRLAVGVRWIHQWLTQRRWGIPAFAVVVSMLFAAALGALGVAFDRDPLLVAGGPLSGGAAVVLLFIVWRGFRQQLRAAGSGETALPLIAMGVAYPAVVSCLYLLVGEALDPWEIFVGFSLAWALTVASAAIIDRAIERAARRYAGRSEQGRRQTWSEDHPWRAAAAAVAPLPLGLIPLIAVFPAAAPAALRVGLLAVVGLMTALAAGAVRLESGRREREAYQRVYMSDSS